MKISELPYSEIGDTLISIVMPVKNEEESIDCIIDILEQNHGVIGEIFIMDDHSTDATYLKVKKLTNSFDNVHLFRNDENLEFNLMIEFLLKKVKTRYVHLRTPHDIFDTDFYKYHLERFRQYPSAKISTNNCAVLSDGTQTGTNGISLSVAASRIYNRLLDKSYSSCGFVAETEKFVKTWSTYKNLGKYTDWIVKKELCIFNPAIQSFATLALYNDHKNQKSCTPKLFTSQEIARNRVDVLSAICDKFLSHDKSYLTYPEHEISAMTAMSFFIGKITLFTGCKFLLRILFLYSVKKLIRFLTVRSK